MTYYITSDTHFRHKNIIEYCERPFASIEEHDAALIANWNEIVSESDTVIHLGDFVWAKEREDVEAIRSQLNGHLIMLRGNHDKMFPKQTAMQNVQKRQWIEHLFDSYYPSGQAEVKIDGDRYFLNHYPMLAWNGSFHGYVHLFGHVHSKDATLSTREGRIPWFCMPNSYDVGVDNNNYRPIKLKDAAERARAKGAPYHYPDPMRA